MKNNLESLIIDLVASLTEDWEMDDIELSPSTRLVRDASFESLDIVQLLALVEKSLGNPGIRFEELFMKDGVYVEDVSIEDLAAFIASSVRA